MSIEKDMTGKTPIFQAKDITIVAGSEALISGVTISINQDDRIGLVGTNGSGKTTLLKTINKELEPEGGNLLSKCSIQYVPQVTIVRSNESILDYVSKRYPEWWEVSTFLKQNFDTELEEIHQKISSLSGGELTKLNISIAAMQNPDILLLDEPTNHLDLYSVSKLIQILKDYRGAVVTVSHDTFFLDQITQKIWEISNKRLNTYPGNFSEFLVNKGKIINQVEKSLTEAKKTYHSMQKRREEIQKENAKVNRVGKQLKGDRSMSTIEKGYFKNKATGTAGRKKAQITENISGAMNEIESLKTQKQKLTDKSPYIDINVLETGRKRLLSLENANLWVAGKLLVKDLNLKVYGGDRIAIGGRNSSGKTALVKSLLTSDSRFNIEGDVSIGNTSIAYLSQGYEVVDSETTVYDNIHKSNPNLTYEDIRRILSNFLFSDNRELDKKAKFLSGGELARLSLALVTTNAIDMIILDEPTNNLDEKSIEEFARALENYKGAIIVISHNIGFLEKIGIKQAYLIDKEHTLRKMSNIPHNKIEYYNELIKES